MPTYIVDPNNPASPTDLQGARQGAEEIRGLKTRLAGITAGAVLVGANNYVGPSGLVDFLHINSRYSHRDLIADGWYPAFFNQQWGGAPHYFEMVDSATGTPHKFEAFDSYIETDGTEAIGDVAARFYQYQSFIAPKALNLQAVWFKFYKNGNPVDNLTIKLWSVAAGVPNAVIATANVINGRQITSDTLGQWYRFSFAVAQALVANTQYIITAEKSGGLDAANYYVNRMKAVPTRYPNNLSGIGTSAPVWTTSNTASRLIFICEAQASDQSLTAGGAFNDGKYTFFEGNPLNRSNARCKELKDFKDFHPDDFTFAIYGSSWTKDKTILDITYGLDHDRIVLRSKAATGLPELTIYEKDGTVETITGTTDISTVGDKLISIRIRAKNDGADVLQIWINGAKEAETTLKSYELDELFAQAQIGTFWLGGGWNLASAFAWTQKLDMSTLPSANGWTFTTTTGTVEGNVYTISGGKLNQIRSGMGNAADGNYRRAAAGFNNANGWTVVTKVRIESADNNLSQAPVALDIYDGAKRPQSALHEYFWQSADGGVWNVIGIPQFNLKTFENVLLISGRGSDVYRFANGKLVEDGTSKMLGASAVNVIDFGDIESAAGRNGGSVWDYLAYYNTAIVLPQCTSGNFSEFMLWSGDKTALLATLYNAGAPLSGKQVLGVKQNRLVESDVITRIQLKGITGTPTTTTTWTSTALLPEMECFVLGDKVNMVVFDVVQNNTAPQWVLETCTLDGRLTTEYDLSHSASAGANNSTTVNKMSNFETNFGLHRAEVRWAVSNNTGTSAGKTRNLNVIAGVGKL